METCLVVLALSTFVRTVFTPLSFFAWLLTVFSQPSTRASAFRATTGCGVAASFGLTMTFVFAISTEKPGGARFFLVEAHRRAETGFAHVLLTLGLQALTARTAASVVSETAAAVLRALEPVLPELARVIARSSRPALLANVLHSLVGAFPAHGVAQSAFEAVALVRAVLAPERAVARVLTNRRHEADLAQGGGVHLGQAPPADVVAGGVRVEAVSALRGAVVTVEAVLALELAVSALPPGRALSAVTDAVELVAVVVLAVARQLAVRTVPSFPTVAIAARTEVSCRARAPVGVGEAHQHSPAPGFGVVPAVVLARTPELVRTASNFASVPHEPRWTDAHPFGLVTDSSVQATRAF